MEIVLIIAGVAGLALLIVPCMLRGRSRRVRTDARSQWNGAAASTRPRRRATPVSYATATRRATTAAVGGGAPTALVESEPYEDDWDEDLGWGATVAPEVEAAPEAPEEPAEEPSAPAALDDDLGWDDEPPAVNGPHHRSCPSPWRTTRARRRSRRPPSP